MSHYFRSIVKASSLPRAAKAIYTDMADMTDDHGISFCGLDLLARHTEYSERQVKRIRRALIDSGLLKPLSRGGQGAGDVGRYELTLVIDDPTPLEAIDKTWQFGGTASLVDQHRDYLTWREDRRKARFAPQNKGDMVSPLRGNKGDTSVNKGDTSANKGDMVSPNPETIRNIRKGGPAKKGRPPDRSPAPTRAPFGANTTDIALGVTAAEQLGVTIEGPLNPQMLIFAIAQAAEKRHSAGERVPGMVVELLQDHHPNLATSQLLADRKVDADA